MKYIYHTYKYMLVAVLGMASATPIMAQTITAEGSQACGMGITDVAMKRNADLMTVNIDMNLADFDLEGNRVAVFTPVIAGEKDSLRLHPVGLYSRTRWFQYLRSGDGPVGGVNEVPIRWSERPDKLEYNETFPYSDWMNGSQLLLVRQDYACCRDLLAEDCGLLTEYREVHYAPVFFYVQPVAESVKTRELSGRAYIDFPVNRTEIYPDYRNNPVELRKIIATIDSVRNDRDITVKSITIKGYASPESPWDNNARLAKGRTETLKNYVQNMYRFEPDFIQTEYEPEDWAGLREYVAGSTLEHRAEILAIIDGTLEPDPKEWKIKSSYPEEYQFLLQTVYPGLRHSDYRIEYTIRGFSDVNELRETMAKAPQKLSLNEMFLLAQSYEPGSLEYNEVFETAVRMFPENETANLNAANTAMQRGDLNSAEKYLAKAGGSADTVYAKGVLAALKGDYTGAEALVREAAAKGLQGTEEVLDHLAEVQKYL